MTRVCMMLMALLGWGAVALAADSGDVHLEDEEIPVQGQLLLPKGFRLSQVEILESRLVLMEEFTPRPLPTPEGFDDWEAGKRAEWLEEWRESEAGRKFQQSEEQRFDQLRKYETEVDEKLKFGFSKVIPGNYDLAGEIVCKRKDQQYLAEFFAQVKVSKVNELKLDEIELTCHRLLTSGDQVPNWSSDAASLSRPDVISPQGTLVIFWSRGRGIQPALEEELKSLKQQSELRVVSIGVGQLPADKPTEIREPTAHARCTVESLDHELTKAWGIRMLPALWLVNGDGKIVATPADWINASGDLRKVIEEKLN